MNGWVIWNNKPLSTRSFQESWLVFVETCVFLLGFFVTAFLVNFDAIFPNQYFDWPTIALFSTACAFSLSEKSLLRAVLTFYNIYLPRIQRKNRAGKSWANWAWYTYLNKDWGCVILHEIDFLLKICWSIPCLHASWKVHTWNLVHRGTSTFY